MQYRKKETLICEQIEDELIIFDTEKEHFYEFDDFGAFVWNLFEKLSFDDLIQRICSEYDIDNDTVAKDMCEFFNVLENNGLVYKIEA